MCNKKYYTGSAAMYTGFPQLPVTSQNKMNPEKKCTDEDIMAKKQTILHSNTKKYSNVNHLIQYPVHSNVLTIATPFPSLFV